MSIATVKVLHSFIEDGVWVPVGLADLPVVRARELEATGYVDVLAVDGMPEVWAPCCGDEGHAH